VREFATYGLSIEEGMKLTSKELKAYSEGFMENLAMNNIHMTKLLNMFGAANFKNYKMQSAKEVIGIKEKKYDDFDKKLIKASEIKRRAKLRKRGELNG
jgi:hypothetical protein